MNPTSYDFFVSITLIPQKIISTFNNSEHLNSFIIVHTFLYF